MLSLWLALALGVAPAGTIEVRVPAPPGVLFNRLGSSTVTLRTPWGEQTAKLSGTPDKTDPEHYWASARPLKFQLKVPNEMKTVLVTLSADLFLCDARAHLCYRRQLSMKAQVNRKAARLTFEAGTLSPTP